MPKVYLCGTMTQDPRCSEWRELVSKELKAVGIDVLDPSRHKDPKEWSKNGFEGKGTIYDNGAFVARDLEDIQKCDALLMYWWGEPGRQSIGTWMELGYAKAYNRPVCVVDITGEYVLHPFVYKTAAACFKALADGVSYIKWLTL